jgi:GTPase SAR1 family protein
MEDTVVPCLIKIVLLGNAQAGKSSLMQAYTSNSIADPNQPYVPLLHCTNRADDASPQVPTRGVEFCTGSSELFGKRIKFQVLCLGLCTSD